MSTPRLARAGHRRGATAIEFGLWMPVLMAFLSAVVDYGSYMNERVATSRAVMEGCRSGAAIFEPDDVAPGSVILPTAETRASRVLTDLGVKCPAPDCLITGTYCPAGAGGSCGAPPFDAILLEIDHQFSPRIGMLPTPDRIRERFMMAVENQRSAGDDDAGG